MPLEEMDRLNCNYGESELLSLPDVREFSLHPSSSDELNHKIPQRGFELRTPDSHEVQLWRRRGRDFNLLVDV